VDALERFRKSGRKLILVTGRELEDLESVFPRLELFDRVVAENGAVHPDLLPAAPVQAADVLIAVGDEAGQVIRSFGKVAGTALPPFETVELLKHNAMVWFRDSGEARRVELVESETSRHTLRVR